MRTVDGDAAGGEESFLFAGLVASYPYIRARGSPFTDVWGEMWKRCGKAWGEIGIPVWGCEGIWIRVGAGRYFIQEVRLAISFRLQLEFIFISLLCLISPRIQNSFSIILQSESIRMPNDKPKTLRIGVLILPPSQLLDVSPIDLFGMLAREYLEACRLPAPILALGISVEIHYISATASPQPESTASLEDTLAECTAKAALRVTATVCDAAIAPGKLDIILIPGPDPNLDPPESMGKFIRDHFDTGCVIMSVCTGIFPLAASGVLTGKKATGPRALLSELRKKYPNTVWSDKRWCKDGNVWSSGMFATSQFQSCCGKNCSVMALVVDSMQFFLAR